MKFKWLFLKELKQENTWFTMGIPALIGFELILLLFSARWQKQCLAISGFPLITIPFCVLWNINHSYIDEWTRKTSQYLFSLPVRGWHIFSAKFAVQTLFLIISSFIAFFTFYFLGKIRFHCTFGITPIKVVKFWLIYLILILPGMSFNTFPFIVSKCFVRFQQLIIALISLVLFITIWHHLIPFGQKLFGFLPEATITIVEIGGSIKTHSSTNFFPCLAMWVLWGLLLFCGNCLVLDKWTETQ